MSDEEGNASDFRGNGSFSKGFDHRENDPLPVSPSPARNSLFNNSGNNMNHEGGSPKAGAPQGGIELQFGPGLPGDLLANLVEPEIEDDTEAAEALRANASIKVGKLGKVARSVNAQTVRKLAKKATLRGHGNKRGKPPRIPPGLAAQGENQQFLDDANQIYAVQEADQESE